jgi:hypothetical protein
MMELLELPTLVVEVELVVHTVALELIVALVVVVLS